MLSKASVNHEKIVEGLAQALWQISEHIAECDMKRELFPTEQMQGEIARFYAEIFLFLSDVMSWMTRKRHERLIDSFKEDFNKRFDDQVEKITAISEKMRTLAALGAFAEQRVVRLNVEKIESDIQDIRTGLEGDSRARAEQIHKMETLQRELLDLKAAVRDEGQNLKRLGSDLQRFLQGQALQYISSEPPEHRYLPPPSPQPIAQNPPPAETPPKPTLWTSASVALDSRDLEDYFHRDRVRLHPDADLNPITVSATTAARLSSWLASSPASASSSRSAPSTLWLAGPDVAADAFANPVTVLATQLLRLADARGIPTISYFCELRRGERLRTGNVSREAQAAVALVCALIRQAVELLPPPPLQPPAADETGEATAVDLSEQRFREVDGTVLAWDEAVGVLRDVLGLLPRTVVCVVDGMQWLDDSSTAVYLGELVKALRRQERLKVLLTTAGRSRCLLRELDASELLEFECGDGAGLLA
ncbi:hypothetical protein DBV05_g11541 [Lasiodiplodia theobromae]|uniref:DUF7708 domain-containing protein n=1 Tax=Lasiodiplodia theobromae TaxID=45133 RepID=A0A5N5CWN9_9PEZI|nr:hypothetical protein DBV05_g11541 [Lasiodiplodia theobromae]